MTGIKCPICESMNTNYDTVQREDVYGSILTETTIVCGDCDEVF